MSIETPRLLNAGKSGILIETDGAADTLGLVDQLRRYPPPDMIDFLPAETTVMVFARDSADMAALRADIHSLCRSSTAVSDEHEPDHIVTVPVHYDGADLHEVANMCGQSTEVIVARHTGQLWRCAFIGFAPGFSYLSPTSGSPFIIPRREQSRASVPPGAVALAGRFSGVYPRSSPGGWQVIGRTDAQMWNVDNDPPALVQPGHYVRFVDAGIS
ncbi:hypothetical protein CH298_02410 [Rhodococcoides fascians]|uniref:5-oxoprolinase subunit B family protein n=1 Tax=Rhodococcoides fascians TaxID=1828 RepID=UPI000B9B28E6|nr:allophanate hydrolase subunit 1 [Rhodococcus fascians]OZE92412.1 hypothetical protein CH303_02410 [Rhodococcus fascians]OZF23045.1 hypothetical protein CH298_02410 [Rhodococcus fascians]OZF24759.1 hypothetical protein CH297_02410 [Rhodococcus fascians]OZF73008.1 hypothetical protein CH308_02415 [Rhodococcus fascians]OZF74173.1 hypothetical protein CH307_02410 [Rhodococcus fascians]